VNQMIRLRQYFGAERIWACESGNDQSRSAWRSMDKQRRKQRRILRRAGDVGFFLYRDCDVALMRCRRHGIGAGRFLLTLEVFKKGDEPFEALELMGVHGEEVSRFVIQSL